MPSSTSSLSTLSSLIDFEQQNAAEWDLEAPACRPQKPVFQEPGDPKASSDARLRPGLSAPPGGNINLRVRKTTFPQRPYVTGSRNAQALSSVRKAADKLPGERDNEAKAAWRKRAPPTGSYELPSEHDRIDSRVFRKQHGAMTRGSERSPYFILEQIGSQIGAYIEPPSNLSTRLLKIWGTEIQVQAAKLALHNWIQAQKQARLASGARWAKPNTEPSARKRTAIDNKMEQEAWGRTFRRNPRDTEDFTATGIFQYPSKEYDLRAILGPNLEAFDQIKVDCDCHVVLQEKMSALKLFSNNFAGLTEAIGRIKVAFCEMASRNNKPRRLYLIEPPTPETFRNEIELESQKGSPYWAKLDERLNIHGVIPIVAGPKPTPEDMVLWESDRRDLSFENHQSLKHAIMNVLADLRFYRGHCQMRVHFGLPVLTTYKKPAGERHTFEEFASMLKLSPARAEVVKCIGNSETAAALMSQCCQSTDMFVPGDAMTHALEDIKPVLSATFDFTGSNASGPFRLELEFKKVEDDDEYEVSAVRWLKHTVTGGHDPDIFGARKPRMALEAVTMNLDKKIGWQLEVTTATKMEASKVTPEMHDFVKLVYVEVPQPSTAKEAHPKVIFLHTSALGIKSFVQQSKFQYLLVDSDYIWEITKYEYSTQGLGGVLCTSSDAIWGASFYNSQWDTTLKGQVDLGVGKAGEWLPDLYTFFPRGRVSPMVSMTNNGFEEFVEKIEAMTKLLTNE
ncbi:MAG: hypothetical protein M1839_001093 [Geoglossum umbratile]|nr:MAG: hypothetical protein M1839_001093 [Geoglossum umbratile]